MTPQDPTLPPGVSLGMIPGNRPEDEWFDHFVDDLSIPEEFFHIASAEKTVALVNSFLKVMAEVIASALAEQHITEASTPDVPAGMVLVPVDSLPPDHEYHP